MTATVRQTVEGAIARPKAVLGLSQAGVLAREPALWLAFLTVGLYLLPAARLVRLNNDSTEYYDAARRMVAGEGYRLGVKAFLFGGSDVLHNALDERAPFYSLFMAAFLRLGLGLSALQVANVLFAAGSAALVYAIGTALFGRRIGVMAGLLSAASPVVLSYLVPPMTEASATFLLLLAAWLVIRRLEAPRVVDFAAAGLALGLGYLTRPTTPMLGAALLLGVVLASRDRRALLIRPLAALLMGMAIFILPVTLYSLATRGSPSYSQSWLYSVFDQTEHREFSDRPLSSSLEFIRANPGFVVTGSLGNTRAFAEKVFLDRTWLLFLLPAWPAVLLALVRGRYLRIAWPVLLLAAANFFVYGLTWAVHDRRFQVPVVPLLLPFAVDGLARLGLARLRPWRVSGVTALHLAVAAVVLLWLSVLVQDYRTTFFADSKSSRVRLYNGLRWDALTFWLENVDKVDNPEFSQLLDWMITHTERDDVVAHGFPWPFTFFTERPAALLPADLETEGLRAFIAHYHVAYVVISRADPARRGSLEALQALESAGVRQANVRAYRIFETRVLWR